MTIHSEHPFDPPEAERDPVRRLRGRLGGAVTLWTAGTATDPGASARRGGLPVSSVMVAAGEPSHVLGLLDPDCDLLDVVAETGCVVVQLLEWEHRNLADAFGGRFPAPGGPFTLGTWVDTDWGPRLTTATAWAGVRLVEPGRDVGWSRLVTGVLEHVEIGTEVAPLVHRRGRYLRPSSG